jgi:hypothetical protein
LVKFQGSDDRTITPDDRSKYTMAFATDGNGRIDCKRGRATWKLPGANQNSIRFDGSYPRLCPPAPLTDRIPKGWEYIRSKPFWKISRAEAPAEVIDRTVSNIPVILPFHSKSVYDSSRIHSSEFVTMMRAPVNFLQSIERPLRRKSR